MSEALDLLGDPIMTRGGVCGRRAYRPVAALGPGPSPLVIGCNPSTADGLKDDQTSLWWNAWFYLLGFGGYDAVNLYPFCTASPAECRKRVGAIAGGDWHARDQLHFVKPARLTELAKAANQVFVCWGNIAWDWDWIEHVVEEIQSGVRGIRTSGAGGQTKSGAPIHPASRGKHRIPRDQQPIIWRKAA